MHPPLKHLTFAAITLLYSVGFPNLLLGMTANEATSNLQPEAKQLPQDSRDELKPSQLPEAAPSSEPAPNISQQLDVSHPKNTTSPTDKVQTLRELANFYTSLKNSSKVIEFCKQILPLARELGESDTELKLLTALGDAYNSVGNYTQAIESANASLSLAGELRNSQAQALAYLTLATAYQNLASVPSDYQKATMAAISSLTTSWTIKDRESEAKALALLGNIYNLRREKENAILFAQQGLKVARENNVPSAAASSLLTLAGVHLETAQYPQAIASTEEGREVLQKLKQREEEGAALVMEGLAYLGGGNTQKSLKLAEQGLAIAQEIKSLRLEALSLIVLSLSHAQGRDSPKAIELINQSRMIAKELNNPSLEAITLEVLGEIYRKSGQREQAIVSYQEAVSISNSFSALAGLSRLYQESNLMATAIAYYKQAVNKNEEQHIRIIAGFPLWLQESFPQAIQDIHGLGTTHVYRAFANLLILEKRQLEAVQVIELLKGQELREYTGNSRINNLATSQPASITITPTEQQILREYGSLVTFGYRLEECKKTRCSELEQLLGQREDLTKKYNQSLEQIETALRNKRTMDEAFVDPNQFVLKARRIVESQPGTLLVYPLVLEDKILLIWASKGGIFTSVEVPNVRQAELEVTVARFRQLLQNRLSRVDEVQATGKQLYDWLLKPLEQELKKNDIKNLVFALDRSTRYIPMSALYDGKQYLIENYTVSTVLSANLTDTRSPTDEKRMAKLPISSDRKGTQVAFNPQFARASRQDHPKSKIETPQSSSSSDPTILALGVSQAMQGFSPLPNVPPELDAIVKQEADRAAGIYSGQKFLDRAFDFFALRDNLPNHRLLHIATHSKFVPGRANQSFLLLGTGETFAIPDIERWLNLQGIDLVVLSACETALGGPGMDGREIAGVGYYFLKGGAKTVIASLWNVDDYSTRLLMEQFYENLAQGTPTSPVTKAKALRQAQLALLQGKIREAHAPRATSSMNRSHNLNENSSSRPDVPITALRHPYYWAPFILMGSGL